MQSERIELPRVRPQVKFNLTEIGQKLRDEIRNTIESGRQEIFDFKPPVIYSPVEGLEEDKLLKGWSFIYNLVEQRKLHDLKNAATQRQEALADGRRLKKGYGSPANRRKKRNFQNKGKNQGLSFVKKDFQSNDSHKDLSSQDLITNMTTGIQNLLKRSTFQKRKGSVMDETIDKAQLYEQMILDKEQKEKTKRQKLQHRTQMLKKHNYTMIYKGNRVQSIIGNPQSRNSQGYQSYFSQRSKSPSLQVRCQTALTQNDLIQFDGGEMNNRKQSSQKQRRRIITLYTDQLNRNCQIQKQIEGHSKFWSKIDQEFKLKDPNRSVQYDNEKSIDMPGELQSIEIIHTLPAEEITPYQSKQLINLPPQTSQRNEIAQSVMVVRKQLQANTSNFQATSRSKIDTQRLTNLSEREGQLLQNTAESAKKLKFCYQSMLGPKAREKLKKLIQVKDLN